VTLVFIYTKILPLSKVVSVTITAIKMKLKKAFKQKKHFSMYFEEGGGGTLQQVTQLGHNYKPKKNTYIQTTNRWL